MKLVDDDIPLLDENILTLLKMECKLRPMSYRTATRAQRHEHMLDI
jgi:hypothetical protein